MAAWEMYDELTTVAADVDATLTIKPWKIIPVEPVFAQDILVADDKSEQVIEHDTATYFLILLQFKMLTAADHGTINGLFYTSAEKYKYSIKWDHPTDGHTYVFKFRSPLKFQYDHASRLAIPETKILVIGRIADP